MNPNATSELESEVTKTTRTGRRKQALKNLMKRGGVWYFKKMVAGRVTYVSLKTSDVELAKTRRNELARLALAENWQVIDGVRTRRAMATIGEVCAAFLAATDLQLQRKTAEDYVWALKHVLKTVSGEPGAVEERRVDVLDAALCREWQQRCLEKVTGAGPGSAPRVVDRLKADTAAVSANSVLSQARSVFSKRALQRDIYRGLALPDLAGFLRAPLLQVLKRDHYEKPPDAIISKVWRAAGYLAGSAPRADRTAQRAVPTHIQEARAQRWLVFWLAAQTGLRRAEIEAMRWSWFDGPWVRVRFEADFIPKGKRERPVPVAAAVATQALAVARARGWPTAPADRVLPCPTPGERDRVFRTFGRWLDKLGWPRRQKAHELRKIFATDLTAAGDPYDTQRALGHQDLKTTMRYAARRQVAAVDQAARYGQ